MWCNQIFSLIHEDEIKNTIVCDNFEVANQIARITYGEDAIAVDTTLYPVTLGDRYIDGIFYRGDEVILRNPTEAERITAIEEKQMESELDIDFRLSMLELGLV